MALESEETPETIELLKNQMTDSLNIMIFINPMNQFLNIKKLNIKNSLVTMKKLN